MKKLLFVFLLSFSAQAEEPHFTTVFYDDGGIVYTALKREDSGKKESQIITFPFQGGTRVRIPLPEEITNRDIIGLIPEKKKLFVLTHGNESEKDGPMLHIFNSIDNSWKKLGALACPAFTKVKLSFTKMRFFCETNPPLNANQKKKRKSSVVAKTISFGKERLYRSGTWRFPEFMLRYKSVFLLLEGNAPKWDKLRLKSAEGERVLLANEIFQLPAPVGSEPTPPPPHVETEIDSTLGS
jgi:hypothetical protein